MGEFCYTQETRHATRQSGVQPHDKSLSTVFHEIRTLTHSKTCESLGEIGVLGRMHPLFWRGQL